MTLELTQWMAKCWWRWLRWLQWRLRWRCWWSSLNQWLLLSERAVVGSCHNNTAAHSCNISGQPDQPTNNERTDRTTEVMRYVHHHANAMAYHVHPLVYVHQPSTAPYTIHHGHGQSAQPQMVYVSHSSKMLLVQNVKLQSLRVLRCTVENFGCDIWWTLEPGSTKLRRKWFLHQEQRD